MNCTLRFDKRRRNQFVSQQNVNITIFIPTQITIPLKKCHLAAFVPRDFMRFYSGKIANLISVQVKSLSEAFILTSTNPKYDKRLLVDLQVQYMKTTSSEHGENMLCTQIVFSFCFDIQNNLCTQHVLSLEFSCTELINQ